MSSSTEEFLTRHFEELHLVAQYPVCFPVTEISLNIRPTLARHFGVMDWKKPALFLINPKTHEALIVTDHEKIPVNLDLTAMLGALPVTADNIIGHVFLSGGKIMAENGMLAIMVVPGFWRIVVNQREGSESHTPITERVERIREQSGQS